MPSDPPPSPPSLFYLNPAPCPIQAEADAIEVVAHLRKELAQATDELKAAKEQVKETRRQTRAECEEMEEECAVKIRQIALQLNDKASEVRACAAADSAGPGLPENHNASLQERQPLFKLKQHTFTSFYFFSSSSSE